MHALPSHRRLLLLLSLAFVCIACLAAGCDDGGSDPPADDTASSDTAEPDTAEPDTLEPDTAEPDTTSDALDDGTGDATGDVTDVWTDPAIFSVVFTDAELRELIYMLDASTITIPAVKIRAESIGRQPIAGQTVAIAADARTRIEPAQSVTDAEGLTDLLTLTLGDDMSEPVAHHKLTPYIVPNEPDTIRNTVTVDAYGATVELVRPTDAEGNPTAPLADGGASTWTLTIALDRADPLDEAPLPGDLEVAIEFVTNMGTPALAFADDPTATSMRWLVDPADPNLTVDLVSTTTEPASARFYLRLHQREGNRGQRLETIDVVAP